jgi:hypothetical protein
MDEEAPDDGVKAPTADGLPILARADRGTTVRVDVVSADEEEDVDGEGEGERLGVDCEEELGTDGPLGR